MIKHFGWSFHYFKLLLIFVYDENFNFEHSHCELIINNVMLLYFDDNHDIIYEQLCNLKQNDEQLEVEKVIL